MEKNFGDTVRQLRKDRHLTQEDLANFLGVAFQSVSKWERNETYPDITTLPRIAAFFGVTTDHLLGADSRDAEAKIQNYIAEYYRLWECGQLRPLCKILKRAIYEHPGDYRLIVRYFNALVTDAMRSNEPLTVRNEAQALYSSIQKHCTTDSIRIWSQKIMANYYKTLAKIENSGIEKDDVHAIVENMPLMQNSRDHVATFLYDGAERQSAIAKAVIEHCYLLGQTAIGYCETEAPSDLKINVLESAIIAIDRFFPDGDYGKLLTTFIWANARLVKCYSELNCKSVTSAANRAMAAARHFDELPAGEIAYTSPLLRGLTYSKQKIPYATSKSQAENLRSFFESIGYTE